MNDVNNDICDLKYDNDTNIEDTAELQTSNNGKKSNIEEERQNIEQLQTDVDEAKKDISEAEQNIENIKTDGEKLQDESTQTNVMITQLEEKII
jgi:chromosome segregation ATPase